MNKLIDHIVRVAKEDVRLYFAPLRGAIRAVKEELQRPRSRPERVRLDKQDTRRRKYR
jgi:hypothetical protein